MALSVLIRLVGALLLLGSVALGIMFWRLTLPLGQRTIVHFGTLVVGVVGLSFAFAGDLPLAGYMVLIGFPFALATVLKLYFIERKLLAKLRMYKAKFKEAQEEGNEDEMVDNHARAASCRWRLPRVKEAQDEDLEDWW